MEGLSGTVMNLAEVECEWVKKGNSLTVVAVACGAINSANILSFHFHSFILSLER